jgi:hypothetical protein
VKTASAIQLREATARGDCAATLAGTLASRWPGNRPAMTPKTLRVRQLTLAPTSSMVQDECSPMKNKGTPMKDDATKILDCEQMERVVAITTPTGACRR